MKDRTILLNWDSDCEYFFLKHLENWEDLPGKAAAYIDTYYKDCGIGDILFNIFGQNSVVPSRVFTDRATKFLQTEENGLPVDYSHCENLSLLYQCQVQQGFDPIYFWVNYCKKIGIRPWISIRMNDNHYRDNDTGWIRSDFFYEALEKGWMLGEKYRSGYRNFNYAVPEVRQKMLEYIREQLLQIDVFGLELDFLREAKCVPYLQDPNCHTYLTEFMAGVKEIAREAENHWGHPLKIAVRVPRDPELCRKIGFDTLAWAQKGYVDAVSPAGHWLCNDTDMPIKAWADLLHPYGVEVWAGMEMNLPQKICISEETAKAHTVQYAAQGSDRTHIYNLYHPYLSYLTDSGVWKKTPSIREIQAVWKVAGDEDACSKGVRRHVVTEEAMGFPEIKERWCPLPAKIGDGFTITVPTGPIRSTDRVKLFVGIRQICPKDIAVSFNGNICNSPDFGMDSNLCLKNPTIPAYRVLDYKVSPGGTDLLYQEVSIEGDPDGIITYLEIKVES